MPSGHRLANIEISRDVLNAWDDEARENARVQASHVRDREAQAVLQAYVSASHPEVQEADTSGAHFNATRLYLRLGKYCKGFLSYTEMRQMHYVTFFAFLREANTLVQEEKDAQETTDGNRVHGYQEQPRSIQRVEDSWLASLMLRRQFGAVQEYQGETVAFE